MNARAPSERPAGVPCADGHPASVAPACEAATFECDACGASIQGEPAGRGLLIWTRGEEMRVEEPPLCEACARALTVAGMGMWDDDGGGDEG